MSAAGICISVIDEAQNGTPQSTYDAAWTTFRNNYPEREFWLLQPGRPNFTLKVPTAYTNDPIANGPIQVARDDGVVANASDWFNICDLGNEPSGSVISVFIDTSGSMRLSTVQASYDKFIVDCENAGIDIVFDTQSGGERWIIPHDKDIPPSANFEVTDSPITLGSGEEATLSWLVFGDVTSASIDQGIGDVTAEPSGSIKVQPTVETVYTLTAVGPAGTTTRTVTVEVFNPPLPTIDNFELDPLTLIYPALAEASWDVSGLLISDVSLTWEIDKSANNVGLSGTQAINADVSGNVTLTATNPSGSTSQDLFLTVYQPVVATISASPNPIPTLGQDFTLSWDVDGSADTITIDPAVTSTGDVLSEGSVALNITQSTTYTISASGNGGTDTASVTVIVYQFPTLTATFPSVVEYGQQYNLPITYDYATNGVTIELRYYNRDPATGTLVEETQTSTLSGTTSDEFTSEISASYETNIPWGENGPFRVQWLLTAGGDGGVINVSSSVIDCIIDREPSVFNIPDTADVFPETDPVSSPPIDIAISDPIIVNNIDIPVEIRADKPIQVRFDDDDPDFDVNWKNLRELGPSTNTPPE